MTGPAPRWALIGMLGGLVCFVLLYALAAQVGKGLVVSPPVALLITTLVLIVAVAPLEYFGGALDFPSLAHWTVAAVLGLVALVANVVLTSQTRPGAASVILLAGLVIFGALLGRFALIELDWLLLVATLYIFVDAYSVFFGPTQALVNRGGLVLAALTVRFPLIGLGRTAPIVGAADFLVWTAVLQATHRFGLRYARSNAAIVAGLLLTTIIGILTARVVPALPLMMAGYLFVNRDAFRWRQPALWAVAGGTLVFLIVVGVAARWWLLR